MKMKKALEYIICAIILSLCIGSPFTAKASDIITDNNCQYYEFLKAFDTVQKSLPAWQHISFHMIGQAGYIKINSFTDTTCQQVKTVTDYLKKSGTDKLIVDVRDNPGGDLYAGINTANLFVGKGVIATVLLDKQYPVVYYSIGEAIPFHIVVLVNALTASAAELFASAIQQSGTGLLVGVNTYGKSSIQQVTIQEGGTVNKATVGKYLTRNQTDIAGSGLAPDQAVTNEYVPFSTLYGDGSELDENYTLGQTGMKVLRLEEELTALGYDPGNVDGLFTEETSQALKEFKAGFAEDYPPVVKDLQLAKGLDVFLIS